MPKFNVGDHVERIGVLVPAYMRNGTVIRVIPNTGVEDWFTEYEVNFESKLIGNFYETQLQLATPAENSN